MTAHPGVQVEDLRSASHAAAEAAADASIVSEVSIASASATETRTHQPRGSNGRFVGRPVGSAQAQDEDVALQGDRFLDREISWLQFNERVLQLAEDDTTIAESAPVFSFSEGSPHTASNRSVALPGACPRQP